MAGGAAGTAGPRRMRPCVMLHRMAQSPAVGALCGIQYPCIAWWWGGWGSNPRPRDHEVSQGPSLPCMVLGDLLPELRFRDWWPMAFHGPKRPFCGHGVGTDTRHGYPGSRRAAGAVGELRPGAARECRTALNQTQSSGIV